MHIIVTTTDFATAAVDIIHVSDAFFADKFPEWLVGEGLFDTVQYVPQDQDEIIPIFLEHYCRYDMAQTQWSATSADNYIPVKRFSERDFSRL